MLLQHFTQQEIAGLERIFRANLINSASGFKPANLIGTCDGRGQMNVAIFSSVIHLGADPALLGFIQRPVGADSHTYKNIQESGYFTINHIQESFVDKAHQTSARYPKEVSEFEACGLTPVFLDGFQAPYVEESAIKIGLRFVQEMPIALNNTILMIGQIEHVYVPKSLIASAGNILLEDAQDVCISGLDTYFKVSKLVQLPYAKHSDTDKQ